MGISRRVDDNAVGFAVSLLDGVHQVSFMVGLEDRDSDPPLFRMGFDKPAEIRVGGGSVDLRFPDTKHIQVRAVEDQQGFLLICVHLLSPFPVSSYRDQSHRRYLPVCRLRG